MDDTYLLHICGEITWDLADQISDKLYEDCLNETIKTITVPISSPGGDPDAAWTIYTTLKSLPNKKIKTVASGRIYSAGTIPFLAGKERFVFDTTLFLFHPTTIGVSRDEDRARYKVAEELEGLTIDDKYFVNLLKTTLTKASEDDIKRLTHATKSAFLTAKETLRIGLATKIIKDLSEI